MWISGLPRGRQAAAGGSHSRGRGVCWDMDPSLLLWAADAVLLLHLAAAGFIVLVPPLALLGQGRGWSFVHSPWLRLPHLGVAALVLAGDLAGRLCPLTEWEWSLRQAALGRGLPRQSWTAEWAGRLLYADLPDWAFTALYAAILGLTLLTAWAAPVRFRPGRSRTASDK